MSNTRPNYNPSNVTSPSVSVGPLLNDTSATAPSLVDPTLNSIYKNKIVQVGTDYYFVDNDGVAVKLSATPEATTYGTAAPTTAGANAGDTYFVTPLGTAADAANATAAYYWDGTQWVKYPDATGSGGTGTPETVSYAASATPKPTGAVAGDEFFVTSTGTAAGTITEQWIYDGTAWVQRPSGGASTPEATTYGTAAPTTAGVNAGDTYYVTPLGTQADSANATAEYRWDGTKWVKTPGATIEPCGNVFFNSTDPTTATIFDTENPPVTNDNALKNLDCATYYGTDGSTWTSNGTTYKTFVPSCRPKVKVVTANYTLSAADEGYMIYVNSATAVTVTAPANLPAGFIAEIYQEGAGQVTVVGGAGNTLRSANGFKTRVRYSAIGVSYQTTALSNIVGDSTV